MNLILKALFAIASMAYPLLLWVFGNVAWIHIVMAMICVLRAIYGKSGIFLFGGACFVCLAICSAVNKLENVAFYYPVVINTALLIAFVI